MTNVGFIGVGRMGGALLKAVKAGSVGSVIAYDVDAGKVAKAGGRAAKDSAEVASKSDVVFLCVKPKDVQTVLDEIAGAARGKLVVSVAAGVKTKSIEGKLAGARVVRLMPNTPAVVGEMAAAYCLGNSAKAEDGLILEKLLAKAGVLVRVSEDLMDAVTGLSGSGPAYVYYIIDALAKAGEREGLSREDALNLAAQTVKGAAEMILSCKGSPQELIDMVCSPGGTTIEGMRVLEKEEGTLVDIISHATHAATKKSKELSK